MPAPKYPWRKLEVGEAHLIPWSEQPRNERGRGKSVRTAANQIAERSTLRFSCVTTPEGMKIRRLA